VPVGGEAVVDVVEILLRLVLHPQLQPMVLQLRLSPQQQVDAVAEVEALLQQPQWKFRRRRPKVRWRRRYRRQSALESSGPLKARDTPSNTLTEFHRRMAESASFLQRTGDWEIGAISGGSLLAQP
jgi:hypothetical protein